MLVHQLNKYNFQNKIKRKLSNRIPRKTTFRNTKKTYQFQTYYNNKQSINILKKYKNKY